MAHGFTNPNGIQRKRNTMSTPQLTLDPATTALVLIDLQYGIVAMNVHPQPSAEVVARAKRLAQAFRAAQAPVVLVTVGGSPDGKDMLAPIADAAPPPAGAKPPNWSTIVDELEPQPGDLRITKRQWGAFYGTELDLQLRRRGIRTIVLAGITTNVGVESTARDAYERGYEQVFVGDAMASPSAEAHANTLKFTFPRIGRTRTTDEVLAALQSR
jgi:nicotinamidase-related amidase